MGQHDPSLRHHLVHGPSLRSPLHTFLTNALLHCPAELERVAGRAADKHTRNVSLIRVYRGSSHANQTLLDSSTRSSNSLSERFTYPSLWRLGPKKNRRYNCSDYRFPSTLKGVSNLEAQKTNRIECIHKHPFHLLPLSTVPESNKVPGSSQDLNLELECFGISFGVKLAQYLTPHQAP